MAAKNLKYFPAGRMLPWKTMMAAPGS